jgi:hypothetical protein
VAEPPPQRPKPVAVVTLPARVTRIRTTEGIRVVPPEGIPKDGGELMGWLATTDFVPDDD